MLKTICLAVVGRMNYRRVKVAGRYSVGNCTGLGKT